MSSAGQGSDHAHLDASGPREVVYCHRCENEWYKEDHGLVCPRCDGEITEIVRIGFEDVGASERDLTSSQITPENDPRPQQRDRPATPPELRSLRNHNPWGDADSDPEEADIEEHITHGPGGSVLFSRTVRSSSRGTFGSNRTRPDRRERDPFREDPNFVMRDFQTMIGNLIGPGFQPGQAGRSGPDTLFNQGPFGYRPPGAGSPPVVGGRFTFTTTGRPRNANAGQPGGPDDLATYAPPPPNGRYLYVISIRAPPDQVASIIGNLLGPMGAPPGGPTHEEGGMDTGMPPGLRALFGAMLNPINARSGDAVYSQEALDQIISTLMEQHPTSNAPGPAPPNAIAALPKKKLDYELLGPEGTGECSVCMDDVKVGDEVVVLPCSHWFHEACAAAWLGEHNTCPICRKGLESDSATPENRQSSASASTSAFRNEHRARRLSATRPHMNRDNTTPSHNSRQESRNEARLEAIRDVRRLSPTEEGTLRRYQAVGGDLPNDAPAMPGAFMSGYIRPSEINDAQRDTGRGNTSGSDRSRESRRSSRSNNSGGAMGWLRERFGSDRRNH